MAEEIQSLDTAKEVGHTVVDVQGLVDSMKENLGSISESPPLFHICRVPAHIRKDNHVYYNPKIVSIGPFHRRRRNVRAMEKHKWRYLHKVIHRSSEPYELLKRCVENMKNMEEEVRKCYSGSMLNLGKDEFVKMMLLDGCFVIQILLSQDQSEKNDPIKNNKWMMSLIAEDMLLLENQLPFSVLTRLANLIDLTTDTLKRKAIGFLFPDLLYNFDQRTKNESPEHGTPLPEHETDIHHLLHLVHWSLEPAHPSNAKPCCAQLLQAVWKILSFQSLWGLANDNNDDNSLPDQGQEAGASSITVHQQAGASSITEQPQEAGASSITEQPQEAGASSITEQPQETGASSITLNSIPTATELEEAGVVFKSKEGGSLLDVTFKNGVMRLPPLQITDDTKSLFRNIIAFEQCFPDSGGGFTSYCFFMDSLVNTPRDVQILKQSHIIDNQLGSDEEVALLFNQLCKEIVGSLDNGSVRKPCEDVNGYADKRLHKWRARLKRDYFSNPWAVISLIAAVYVIFLTSVQTYYAAF